MIGIHGFSPHSRRHHAEALEGALLPILAFVGNPEFIAEETEQGGFQASLILNGLRVATKEGRTPREAGAEIGVTILEMLTKSLALPDSLDTIQRADSAIDLLENVIPEGPQLFESEGEVKNCLESTLTTIAIGFLENLGGVGIRMDKLGTKEGDEAGPFAYCAHIMNCRGETLYSTKPLDPEDCGFELAQQLTKRFLSAAVLPDIKQASGSYGALPGWPKKATNTAPDEFPLERNSLPVTMADTFTRLMTSGKYDLSDIEVTRNGDGSFCLVSIFDKNKRRFAYPGGDSENIETATFSLLAKMLMHLKKPAKNKKIMRAVWNRMAWKFVQQLTTEEISFLRAKDLCEKIKKEEREEKQFADYIFFDDFMTDAPKT